MIDKIKRIKIPKNLLKILILLAGLFLLVGVFLSFGIYHAANIRNYALESEKMFLELKGWDKSLEKDESLNATKNRIEKIKTDSSKHISVLERKRAPKEETSLRSNLLEYLNITNKISTETLSMIDWSIAVESATKESTGINSSSLATPESIAASFEAAKININAMIVRLKKINPPKSVNDFHNAFIKTLEGLVLTYDKLIDAVKNNKLDELAAISTELSASQAMMDSVPTPFSNIEKEYEADIKRISELETIIKTDIDKYSKTRFSF